MIDEQKGASTAESILEELGIETLPIKPEMVANEINDPSFKLVFESVPFDSLAILGKAIGNDHGAIVCVNSNIPDPGRFNFTAAHELGHVCMHIMTGAKKSFECGNNEIYNPHTDPKEKEANGFASGLLMPRKLIKPLTDGEINWANIQTISEMCETSLEATFRRLNALNRSPIALVIHQNGKFRRFVASDNFYFYISKSNLTRDQASFCVDVKSEGYPVNFFEVDAADWVNPQSRGDVLEQVYASSISLNEGFVYTLLTYDDECFDDVENS